MQLMRREWIDVDRFGASTVTETEADDAGTDGADAAADAAAGSGADAADDDAMVVDAQGDDERNDGAEEGQDLDRPPIDEEDFIV